MFKIFKKEFDKKNNCNNEIINNNMCIASDGSIVRIFGNGEYWETIDKNKYLIVPTIIFSKENLAFTLIEPISGTFIDVYKIGSHYIANECNEKDLVGIYYLVNSIDKFKQDESNNFSFISYHNFVDVF